MIKLYESANFGGVLHKSGEVVSLSPLVENRMIENGYAVKYPEEKPVVNQIVTEPEETPEKNRTQSPKKQQKNKSGAKK